MKLGELRQPLFLQERQQQIASLLEEEQRITVAELSRLFSVSQVTIRKDLAQLQGRRMIRRTHGGAVSENRSLVESAFEIREQLQEAEKQRIGAAAARLIKEGSVVALDASTTALYLARHLNEYADLTVITNGLRVGIELTNAPGITVLMPGGAVRREAFSLVGAWADAVLHGVHIQKAFVGAEGLTLAEGLTDSSIEEVTRKRAVVEAAEEVIAIIDHSKWGKTAVATFCSLDYITCIITDKFAPEDMVEQVRARGIEVRLV